MNYGAHIAAIVALACLLVRCASGLGAENLAPAGFPLLGAGTGIGGGGDLTVDHNGPISEINDGVPSANLAPDGFQINADGQTSTNGNGSDTFAGGLSAGAYDFVGIRFAEPQFGIGSVRVQNFLADDGGWWGPTANVAGGAPLSSTDLTAPLVQVSSDGGASWRTVASDSDYVAKYIGRVRGSGFPNATSGPFATFTFAEQNGIDAIRLIGSGAGPADGNGFIGVNEFEVLGVAQELSLLVNTGNGQVDIVNARQAGISFDFYEVRSATHSLSLAGWNSLAAPAGNLDGFPAGSGSGAGWEELGQLDDGVVAEAYLQGASTLEPGQRATLGYLFGGDIEDLAFTYRTATGRVVNADVIYFAGTPGDLNGDLFVDGADYLAWQRGFGAAFDKADLAAWQEHFGGGAGGGAWAVPEPTTAMLSSGLVAQLMLCRAVTRAGTGILQ